MGEKEYLADGVYVDLDPGGGLVLTTENGIEATNTIHMDAKVLRALDDYRARRLGQVRHAST